MKDTLIIRLTKLALKNALIALEESAHNLNEKMNESSEYSVYFDELTDYHNLKHLVHTMLDLDPYNDLIETVEYHSLSETIEYITIKWRY